MGAASPAGGAAIAGAAGAGAAGVANPAGAATTILVAGASGASAASASTSGVKPVTPIGAPIPSAAANVVPQAGVPLFELAPHNCFACGTLNAHGLGLVLHVEHGRSWTELSLDRGFEGWEGIAHGGIICTILDEVMAWALVGADNWGVTARMNVNFHKPVPVGRPIRAEGSVARMRRRIVETTATLIDSETGETLATATGTYVAAPEDRKQELRQRYGFRVVADHASPETVDADGAGNGAGTTGTTDPAGRIEAVRGGGGR